MANVYRRKQDGKPVGPWLIKVKDPGGLWRPVTLAEARTKADAERLAQDLALRSRRQRDGLEALPPPTSFTVGKLLREWLDQSLTRRPNFSRTDSRVRRHFEANVLGALPVARLTPERIEAYLQERSATGLAPATVNYLRGDLQ